MEGRVRHREGGGKGDVEGRVKHRRSWREGGGWREG